MHLHNQVWYFLVKDLSGELDMATSDLQEELKISSLTKDWDDSFFDSIEELNDV